MHQSPWRLNLSFRFFDSRQHTQMIRGTEKSKRHTSERERERQTRTGISCLCTRASVLASPSGPRHVPLQSDLHQFFFAPMFTSCSQSEDGRAQHASGSLRSHRNSKIIKSGREPALNTATCHLRGDGQLLIPVLSVLNPQVPVHQRYLAALGTSRR